MRLFSIAAGLTFALLRTNLAVAQPQANAIPFVASNPTSPHTSWSGNPVTLKGTLTGPDVLTHSFTYDWNPGGGFPHCSGAVTNSYNIECPVTYTGVVGTVFTAVLTITDTTSSQVSPASNCPPAITQGACYYTSLNAPPPNLPVEVNNAIDNGLWYLHKMMRRFTTGGGAEAGDWTGVGGNVDTNGAGGTGLNALNCGAFENSGFLQTNIPLNAYSDDVRLCLNGVFDNLATIGIGIVTSDTSFGPYDPDSNHNTIGVQHNAGPENYQTGMMMDAIVASGTPGTLVPSGTSLGAAAAGLGSGPGGAYTFKDAVVDMVDDYSYCQAPAGTDGWSTFNAGGWHYSCQQLTGDNSVSQWAAIGIIPALRNFAATVTPELHTANKSWLDSSFTQASTNNGYFGYTGSSPIWGPYADTPAGMVQLAMNGLGRGTTSPAGTNLWDSAETFVRDNFGTPEAFGAGASIKAYYYGLFSFTKAMLLHDNSGTGLGNTPISLLQSLDDPGTCAAPGVPVTSPGSGVGPCYRNIDWYAAQTPAFGGTDPTDGVARTLVQDQSPDGSWFGHNFVGNQYYMETGIAITMLNKTVFQPVPVACFTTNPSHVASGGPVTLDGSCSVEQNPANHLVSWQWDVSGTGGTVFTIGPGNPKCLTPSCSKMIANFSLPAGQALPYNYPVRLRVTDSAAPPLTADVLGSVVISAPPNPPNANVKGPNSFCPNTKLVNGIPVPIYHPFTLDGSLSTNPDQGQTDGTPGATPSTIISWLWDYSCSGNFTSASGPQVDASTAFDQPQFYGTSFNVCLKVTNNDNLAFPSAGLSAGLSSVAAGGVTIRQPTDDVCAHCVKDLKSNAKAPSPGVPGNIQLYWTDTNTSTQFTIDHYNVYRSLSPSFIPFTTIAGAGSVPFVPAVQVSSPSGKTVFFLDANVVGGTTYYYRVVPATANDTETCQGNVTLTVTLPKGR